MSRCSNSCAVVGLCVLGAIMFGVAHDLVTAHVAPEYFTVYHPRLIEREEPLPLALFWGCFATWWFGLVAGLLFTVINQFREAPLGAVAIGKRVGVMLAALWGIAMLTLLACLLLTPHFPPTLAVLWGLPHEPRVLAVGIVHSVSYSLAALGTVLIAIWIRRSP
ncbi:MAG TPA: hypothetical protein VEX38_08120 [Fimbriimonadaceae bacterium]|nr:hypothetical protein [Fimbriimonadaceae bacterium]